MDSQGASKMNKIILLFSLLVSAGVIWFMLLLSAAHALQPRAVSASDVSSCTDMKHGDQVMENKRLACFNELYLPLGT